MLLNLKDLLKVANDHHFAVPAFNISDYSMLKAVMQAGEEKQAPIIIAIHPDELRHTGREILQAILEKAIHATIPVCVHLDHGTQFSQIIQAIRLGFTSVMIDGSHLPFEENVAISKKVAEVAHLANVSVEGELGTIGTADTMGEAGSDEIIYTDPDDAARFVAETGVDALAVAIGTAHGLYPQGRVPKLELGRLKEIKARLTMPLVLHGGSGNSDEEIRKAVELGINKINISSDIKAAYYNKMREVLQDKSLREPNMIQPPCEAALKVVACQKIELFRAEGKAHLYARA